MRRAARVLCVDPANRVLLLRWRDPSTGEFVWEPPGGGVEPGETPHEAARRELAEETGLPTDSVGEQFVVVRRDTWWDGQHYVADEEFFLARFTQAREPTRDHLLEHERTTLIGYRWIPWTEIDALGEAVEPPTWRAALTTLAPDGPWARH